jgi:hypothetical protein
MPLMILRLPNHRQERFGSALLTFLVTQNLVSIVVCQFKRCLGPFRSTSAFDPLELARSVPCVAPPVWGGQERKRSDS